MLVFADMLVFDPAQSDSKSSTFTVCRSPAPTPLPVELNAFLSFPDFQEV